MKDQEKQDIERAIERARDGVGSRIDELDRRLRSTLDIKSAASEHAPKLIAGGAALGFLVGFGFPRIFKKLLKVCVPLAIVGLAVKRAREHAALEY
jgi:hypothetical protein